MMGPLWVTIVLLATQVTCSLAQSCDLPSPLNATKASELLQNYTDEMKNNSNSGSVVTVLQLVKFALNTTGDTALTKSKLNWDDICFDHFELTLSQVAFINGEALDNFPGNKTMYEVRILVTSDATTTVIRNVNNTLNTLRDRNVSLDRNLDSFIQNVGFVVQKSNFLSILSYSLKSSDQNSTAILLGYDLRLVNATLAEIAEYLFLTPEQLRKDLTLAYLVRYLLSAQTFLGKVLDFSKNERETRWAEKTAVDLVTNEDTNILTSLKTIYTGNNLTFIQFFWERKLELSYFDYTVTELAASTSIESAVIKNYTIEQLFESLYVYNELNVVYKRSFEASKTMREKILQHYQIANVKILEDTLNVTSSLLERIRDIEFENYAIKYYIQRYVKVHLNTTYQELEAFVKLEPGSLENATVEDFPQLMSRIGVAYAVKALNESGSLKYLLNNHTALENHMKPLKDQIEKDRQPLLKDTTVLLKNFKVSYLIYQYSLEATVIYELTVYQFVKIHLKLEWNTFVLLFNVRNQSQLRTYTFKDLSLFFGFKKYYIFSLEFSVIITRLQRLEIGGGNQCAGDNLCAKGSKCISHLGGYTCNCTAGLNVNPYNYCRDVNECKLYELTNGGCSNRSHCVNTYGSFECACNKGYRKNRDGKCEDVKECSSIFTNKCFPQAICQELIGSYRCICRPGFEFRNRYCKDIDECRTKKNACGNVTHSHCDNQRGSYKCGCQMGFIATYNETVSPKVLLNCSDIDECSRPNRCDKNADCKNTIGSYTCTCKEGYVRDGSSCKENRIIDFSIIRLTYITQTKRLRTLLGFYYGGKAHSEIYISTNGLISIGKRYSRSSPRSCRRGRKRDIIAPFWASTIGGRIGYQQLAKEDESSGPALERINEIINQTTKLAGFEANWALVVSWANCTPKYCRRRKCWSQYRDETNTFQAVLATNGSTSVVMFLYDDNGMNWFRRLGRRAMVGYATRLGACKEFQGSFTQSIFDIDDQSFVDPAGKSRRGVIVVVLSKPNEPPTPEEQCLSWIRKQPNNNEWIDEIPSCPCTWRAAIFDSRFEFWKRDNIRTCYAYIRGERTKTCCYFRFGFWVRGALITRRRTAGRVARYSPVSKRDSYSKYDDEPFQLCCIKSNKYCNDFSELRPIEDSCSSRPRRPCFCQWRFGWRRPRIRRVVVVVVVRRVWWRISFRRAWFFGDPHITTLDGFKYSFNGLGDYVMLSTSDKSHVLHGKTFRPPYKDTNRLSNATVFSGFAMKNKMNTTVQVQFNDSMSGNLSIVVHDTKQVCQPMFGINTLGKAPGFVLKKSNDTLIVLFEDSGFSVEITPGIGLLQISFTVPPDLADKNTTGLLGKLNGNKTDDLTFPNGTVLPIDSTDKDIFKFGQTWKVQDSDGLFVDEDCSKMPVYFDGGFRPTFLSDFNRSAIDESIIQKCQNNDQCILDILLTGNEAMGLQTVAFDKKEDEKRAAMDNQPPDITVTPDQVNVTVGETINITVSAKDPNEGDEVFLSDTGNLPKGSKFDNKTNIFTWTPTSAQKDEDFKIEFVAKDKQDASQTMSVEVKFCDCKNGQPCDFTNVLRSNPNNSLEVVGCKCSERYSGDDCGTENDPCENDPCYETVNCTAKAAPEFGYICDACPDGLVGDGENCNDFDECADSANNTCTINQICINTVESYKCQCKPGYKVLTPGGNCTDVNECHPNFGVNDCGANTVCTNTLGGFNCTCKEGYTGDPKKGCKDIDECLEDGRCNHICENTVGSFKCKCFPGFKLNKTRPGYYECVDFDECKYQIDNDCEQICTNEPASYKCSCKEGYKLEANNKTCSVNESCSSSSHGCADECAKISSQDKCQCYKGYKLLADNKKCQDINECSVNNGGCAQKCINAPGNYSCLCEPGYELMANKRDCQDVDECKKDNGGCEAKCTNTKGSRKCSCKRGYKLDGKTKCIDIDECKEGPGCPAKGQVCKNKKGGYKCRCKARQFSDGTFGCKKSRRLKLKIRLVKYLTRVLVWKIELDDEYSVYYQETARLVIVNINAFFKTKSRYRKSYFGCRVNGFRRGSIIANVSVNFDPSSNVTVSGLNQEVSNASNTEMGDLNVDPLASSASDVDECNDPEANDCSTDATCTNTEGSFSCSCHSGYEGDGVNCVKIKEKSNKTALIVGICVGVSLLIIIIIILFLCCFKRNQKGGLHVTDEDGNAGMRPVKMKERPNSGEVYYGDKNGRRGSDLSVEGDYDVATATVNYYDNPVMKKDSETPM